MNNKTLKKTWTLKQKHKIFIHLGFPDFEITKSEPIKLITFFI